VHDFTVASWGLDDGLPSLRVWAIAEDAAGYLWLGTDDGLVRFDGVRFRRWTPIEGRPIQKGAVIKIFSARDGSIWLGQGPAGEGVSRVINGRVENYGRAGLADAAITLLLQDRNGATWAGNDDGLFELRDQHWKRLAAEDGVPRAAVFGGFEDSRGNLWISTSRGILRKAASATRFDVVDAAQRGVRGFTEAPDGAIWRTDAADGFRMMGRGRAATHMRGSGTEVLFDSRMGLWVATVDRGLWRVRLDESAPVVTPVSAATRWPNDVLRTLHEDRNGNIWVAADSGLYRFTPRKATALTNLGRTRVIAGTPDGSVWVGAAGGLVRVRAGVSTVYGPRRGLAGSDVTALATDRSGTLWVGTTTGITRVKGERLTPVDFRGAHLSNIRFVGARSDESLWIYDNDEGLFEWRDGRLARFEPPLDIRERRVRGLYIDRGDRVWISFTGGNVLVVTANRESRLYPLPDEHTLINTIFQDRGGNIWLGGTQGLSRFDNGRFVTLAQSRLPGYAVFSIAEDAADNLWLGGALGIVRLSKQEFNAAVARPDYRPHYDMYDATDGIAGMPVWLGTPDAVASAGRIWFVTTGGVTVIDPQADGHRILPKIQIDAVTANGRPVPPGDRVTLPPDIRNLSFEYTVPSLTSPMKVNFRHRLSNVDAEWVESGSRRDVSYANLAPGTYTFDVAAVSSDRGWSESAASWTFSIRPMFYQTAWFYALIGVTLMLLSWLMWRLRVRQLRRQFSLVVAERARMSREIHDTLLQGMVGVALQFDMLSEVAGPSSSPLVNHLVQLRKQIEEYIRETREAIFDLRVPRSDSDIVKVLQDAGTRLTAGRDVQFNVMVSGTARPAGVTVDRQLVHVAREAITNAVRHARANRIQVKVDYRSDSLLLRVSDDGQGFEVERATRQSTGHYGLVTMRERAQQIGGRVRIKSSVGMGTDVEVTVPLAADI
jgi:signal transduction histidine kinase/ligand-binding sensor domain-containing protein